jgi:hypothetical protein
MRTSRKQGSWILQFADENRIAVQERAANARFRAHPFELTTPAAWRHSPHYVALHRASAYLAGQSHRTTEQF